MTFDRIVYLVLASLVAVGAARAQTKPVVTVYTYSSFVGKYGPGGTIKNRFEANCGCELAFVTAEDAGSLVGRLRLEGETTRADVVLGLDMNLAAEAKSLGIFAEHGQGTAGLSLPTAWTDKTFIPFDWGYLAFVYDSDKLANPPTSLRALVENPAGPKIVLQDPRTSAPGLGFLLWMRQVYGDELGAALDEAEAAGRHFHQGLVGSLRPVSQGRGGHGHVLYDLSRLSHRGGEEGKL